MNNALIYIHGTIAKMYRRPYLKIKNLHLCVTITQFSPRNLAIIEFICMPPDVVYIHITKQINSSRI